MNFTIYKLGLGRSPAGRSLGKALQKFHGGRPLATAIPAQPSIPATNKLSNQQSKQSKISESTISAINNFSNQQIQHAAISFEEIPKRCQATHRLNRSQLALDQSVCNQGNLCLQCAIAIGARVGACQKSRLCLSASGPGPQSGHAKSRASACQMPPNVFSQVQWHCGEHGRGQFQSKDPEEDGQIKLRLCQSSTTPWGCKPLFR